MWNRDIFGILAYPASWLTLHNKNQEIIFVNQMGKQPYIPK